MQKRTPYSRPIASIIIPARNAAAMLDSTIPSVLKEVGQNNIEVIIVNDGCDEETARLASVYPVRVIDGNGAGPAAARNIGVRSSSGENLIFLDADCRVQPGWLSVHLRTHALYNGLLAVGGSICMDPDASFWARCDHFCSWYNVNPGLAAGWVPNHTPANLSIGRKTFEKVGPFQEDLPRAGVHEEALWQSRLLQLGGRLRFEPQAAVTHMDRDDLKGFLKHNYWWAYNSISVKSKTGTSRFPWVFKKPWILVVCFIPFAVLHALYTIVCWLRVGRLEVLTLSPLIFVGRIAYATGMFIGRLQTIQKR